MLSTIVVNTLADPATPTAGVTSLREAIAQAASTSGDETITFASYLSGPVDLSQGQLVLADSSGSLTIQATSGVTTIDAGGASRVFDVQSGTTAMLEDLTVTGGSATDGGGIDNAGTLTLADVIITGNTAADGGGLFNDESSATLTGCTVSGNMATGSAGGIDNYEGTMSLTGSTIAANTAMGGSGGGLLNSGTISLTDSAVSGNTAAGSGGGLYNDGTTTLTGCTVSGNTAGVSGGGLGTYHYSSMSLVDSTVSGNTAGGYGGGLFDYAGTLTLTFATVAGNSAQAAGAEAGAGGGVFAQGTNYTQPTTRLLDTIVAGNTGAAGTPDNLGGVAPVNSGGNVVGSGAVSLDPADNKVGVDDPMLGPLQDNGGPTLTMAELPGSPAIDAGFFLLDQTATDQRGDPRVQGLAPDAGAYELAAATPAPEAPSLVVTTLSDVINPFDDQTSLREALEYAATLPGAQTITFALGLSGTVDLAPYYATVLIADPTGTVTIDGGGSVTLDALGASGVVQVASGTTATLEDLTITGGSATLGGGIDIPRGATLTMTSCSVTGNTASGGGGVFSEGTLTIKGGSISNNQASAPSQLNLGVEGRGPGRLAEVSTEGQPQLLAVTEH
jgi:hypothetical protein